MASTADFKNGLVLNIDGQLWTIVEFQHVKPGKGPAFVTSKLKNVVSGKIVDKTWNAGVKVEVENVDRRDFSYLYNDGEGYVFMDTTDYDQITLSEQIVGDNSNYLVEGQEVTIALHDGNPLYIELPPIIELEVTETDPGLQGDRATGGTKPAKLETGAEIQVPLYLEPNTRVKVDTRDGSFKGRVTA